MGFFKRRAKETDGTANAGGEQTPVDGWLYGECRNQIADLVYRLDESPSIRKKRVIQFIASGPNEGTTSIACAYAEAVARILTRHVLLLTSTRGPAAAPNAATAPATSLDTRIAALLNAARSPAGASFQAVSLPLDDTMIRDIAGGRAEGGFWQALHARYDEIVVDSPSLSVSSIGRLVAMHADAVVVVLEAEQTREPVARKLIDDLRAVRANVVGTIFNKRKFYVPESIYDRL